MGTSATNLNLWNIEYEYGVLNTDGVTVNSSKNTGNIAKQTISFQGLANPFVQTYRYDSLNRLSEAKEMSGINQTWKQVWKYDRYGNRERNGSSQQIGNINSSLTPQNNLTFPTIDANTNRFSDNQGYGYDANGNVINDASADGTRNFTFDGDNKQTEVKLSGNLLSKYFYDGEGKRVKKHVYEPGNSVPTETTVFVYSSGKLIAEYTTAALPDVRTTSYLTTDHLGSPRVISNTNGDVTSRRDFMPFGEELLADNQYRTSGNKYLLTNDGIRQKFTGYEKDEETHLDFAEARYYNNQHSRFTAVDPLLASGKSANPQTFNRYAYTGNNPVNITDPLGLTWYFNSKENKYDWSDDGKKFFYSKGGVTGDWSKIQFNFLYPIQNSDSFVSLDAMSYNYEILSQQTVVVGLTNGSTIARMGGLTRYSPGAELLMDIQTQPTESFVSLMSRPEVQKFLNDPAVRGVSFALGNIASEAQVVNGFQSARATAVVNEVAQGYRAEILASGTEIGATEKAGVAFDTRRGTFAFARSGDELMQKSLLEPSMARGAEEAKALGNLHPWSPRNCCEFKAMNTLLSQGSRRSNIMFQVLDINQGFVAPRCFFCQTSTRGATALNGNR